MFQIVKNGRLAYRLIHDILQNIKKMNSRRTQTLLQEGATAKCRREDNKNDNPILFTHL